MLRDALERGMRAGAPKSGGANQRRRSRDIAGR
jgi:hypothetical protein